MQYPSIVSLKSVSLQRGDKVILRDVNLELRPAEFVYLTGKSGVGKSTLMKALFGLIPLSKGEATVLDFSLKQLNIKNIHTYRRSVGMIFQDFKLFSDWTLYDNYDFVLRATEWKVKSERSERIAEVAGQLGLADKLTTKIHSISGGEQQKVAIGRALLNYPKLLLADEPTGNLDAESAESIIQLLYSLGSQLKTTILLTTHHQHILEKYPARVLVCENGSIH